MCVPIATCKILVQRFKHTTQTLPDILPLSPRIWQCMRQIFVKRLKFLAATFNLRVKQNVGHLGRFLHFSQKVVGVTLKSQCICISTYKVCELVNVASCMEIPELSNDQEELDKKVCLQALNSLRAYPDQHVIIKFSFW